MLNTTHRGCSCWCLGVSVCDWQVYSASHVSAAHCHCGTFCSCRTLCTPLMRTPVLLYGDTCVALEHAATLVIAARSAKLLCWSACVWLHCAARANVGTTAWPQLGPCGIDLSLSLSLSPSLSLSTRCLCARVRGACRRERVRESRCAHVSVT